MSSIEILKQELLYQKNAIESKGGVVQVANTNPSPAEISAGIDSLQIVDISSANAVESDVLEGKTFYSISGGLKTGTLSVDKILKRTFLYDVEPVSTDKYVVDIPDYMTSIREYFMYNNPNYLEVYFHDGITRVEGYAFGNCTNMDFYNFSTMNQLTYVGIQAFANCKKESFDLANMPINITNLQQRSFQNIPMTGRGLRIPNGVTTLGSYVFACDERVDVSSFNFPSSFTNATLQAYMFQNIGAHYDLVIPNTTATISAGFNKGGSFDSVTFGSKVKTLAEKAFGSDDTDPVENFFLKHVTFTNTTPPSVTTDKVFAIQNLQHDFKIYVPDESLEAYKNVAKLKLWYEGYIYPVSMKE